MASFGIDCRFSRSLKKNNNNLLYFCFWILNELKRCIKGYFLKCFYISLFGMFFVINPAYFFDIINAFFFHSDFLVPLLISKKFVITRSFLFRSNRPFHQMQQIFCFCFTSFPYVSLLICKREVRYLTV